MKLYIYANYNNLAGFFGSLVTERIEPDEMINNYEQIVCNLDESQLNLLKECDLYCLGSIDNVTGEIVPEKQFLLHCCVAANKFLRAKSEEVTEDGKESI